ncbi:MAG: 2-hydroxyacid dehydrogenase [Nitrincola lacisaponensis]|uniref:D-lactate dehydrogenase n=1 Tax=Nitrincola lacisaponensis TaxID=267850 RepID=A0A063Y656_9GAMM|nr:2-hydroxyacid dehydrogenase [Nitrincola lacisaponensis]KDE40630.1 D-lactate dehydrogenase [Nitrincola lacisaponensis]
MNIVFYSAQSYDRVFFDRANQSFGFTLHYLDTPLNAETARLASGAQAVCAFVNDVLDEACLDALKHQGVSWIALRCAGFNQVDLEAAKALQLPVVRVPGYSPEAVAEHTLALILTLNRHTHRAYNRVRESNFQLQGLLGFNLHGKTVGLIGTGQIGMATAQILKGFGCELLGYDPYPNQVFEALGGEYVELGELYRRADIISLHCPLSPENHHLINGAALAAMKPGVMLVNTSRGGLVDTRAAIMALKSGQLGYLALDVYEQESEFFFRDLSDEILTDDDLSRLMTFPNVLITGHQGFFTGEALTQIAEITLANLRDLAEKGQCDNQVV